MTTQQQTTIVKCPKCGHFLAEIGSFYRGRCCGYEIIISDLREQRLTTSQRRPTLTPTNE